MNRRAMDPEACTSDSEQAGDEDEDEKTEEDEEQSSADRESKADKHEIAAVNQSKVRESRMHVKTFDFRLCGWSV